MREIDFGRLDKDRYLLLRLLFDTVDDGVVFVVDNRCLLGVILDLLMLALSVILLEYALLLLLEEEVVTFLES